MKKTFPKKLIALVLSITMLMSTCLTTLSLLAEKTVPEYPTKAVSSTGDYWSWFGFKLPGLVANHSYELTFLSSDGKGASLITTFANKGTETSGASISEATYTADTRTVTVKFTVTASGDYFYKTRQHNSTKMTAFELYDITADSGKTTNKLTYDPVNLNGWGTNWYIETSGATSLNNDNAKLTVVDFNPDDFGIGIIDPGTGSDKKQMVRVVGPWNEVAIPMYVEGGKHYEMSYCSKLSTDITAVKVGGWWGTTVSEKEATKETYGGASVTKYKFTAPEGASVVYFIFQFGASENFVGDIKLYNLDTDPNEEANLFDNNFGHGLKDWIVKNSGALADGATDGKYGDKVIIELLDFDFNSLNLPIEPEGETGIFPDKMVTMTGEASKTFGFKLPNLLAKHEYILKFYSSEASEEAERFITEYADKGTATKNSDKVEVIGNTYDPDTHITQIEFKVNESGNYFFKTTGYDEVKLAGFKFFDTADRIKNLVSYSPEVLEGFAADGQDAGKTDTKFTNGGVTLEIKGFEAEPFGFPAAVTTKRMAKLGGSSSGGWFLTLAKAENNKSYELTVDLRAKYYVKDLLAVFYEDNTHSLKRLSDVKITESKTSHKYTLEFKLAADDCNAVNGRVNLFVGYNLYYYAQSRNLTNELYVYNPVLKEKGASDGQNLIVDAGFGNSFAYDATVNSKLTGISWGDYASDKWQSFELVTYDKTVFNKNTTKKMVKLVNPAWEFKYTSEVSVKVGHTYVFALDFFQEVETNEDPIRIQYQGSAEVEYMMLEIFDVKITEDPKLKRYFYEFTVPEDGNVVDGEVKLYLRIFMGEHVGTVMYVANYSLVDQADKTETNLIVNPDYASDFYGYAYWNNECNTVFPGTSDSKDLQRSETDESWTEILDYDDYIFTKTQSELIIGTDWAKAFGPLRVRTFGNDDEELTDVDLDEEDFYYDDDYEFEETEEDEEAQTAETVKKSQKTRKKKVVVVQNNTNYTLWIIGGIIALAVLCGCGVVAVLLIRKKKRKN